MFTLEVTTTRKVLRPAMTYECDEYLFEWDVSNCGTGSYSCFYVPSYYFYSSEAQWTTTPSSGYNGYGGTQSGLDELHQGDGGFLAIKRQNGPQMNPIFHYDATANAWGMVGIGDSTLEIETGKPAGGSSASASAHTVTPVLTTSLFPT